MERLTKIYPSGSWGIDGDIDNAVLKLAAYEDTGLTPEEVQQMRWIPVEERLPGDRQIVLFHQEDGFVYCAEYKSRLKIYACTMEYRLRLLGCRRCHPLDAFTTTT